MKMLFASMFYLLMFHQIEAIYFVGECKTMNIKTFGALNASVTLGCSSSERFGYCTLSRYDTIHCQITVADNYLYSNSSCIRKNLEFTGNTKNHYCAFTINGLQNSGELFNKTCQRQFIFCFDLKKNQIPKIFNICYYFFIRQWQES
jgi:hypothetical protein